MPVIRKLQNNFTAGVLSPGVSERTDLAKYDSGCAEIVNGIVHAHGGISLRPGTRLVEELDGPGRLIPFAYNVEQNYALAFLDRKMRVYRNGGRVLDPDGNPVEIDTPYSLAELPKLKFAQSADTLFLVHPAHPPRKLVRQDHHLWGFSVLKFMPTLPAPKGVTANATGFEDNTDTYVETTATYKVSAVDSRESESLPSEGVTVDTLSTWPTKARVKLRWEPVPGAVRYEIYRDMRGYFEWIGSAENCRFTDDNIEGDDSQGPKENRDPFNPPPVPSGVSAAGSGSGMWGVRVAALNESGVESIAAAEVTGAGALGGFRVEWDRDDAAEANRIYFRPSGADEWSFVDTADLESVEIDKVAVAGFSGKYRNTYEAVVTAVNASGAESDASEPREFTGKATDLWGSSASSRVTVSFDSSPDAEKYRIYLRLKSSTGSTATDTDWRMFEFPAFETEEETGAEEEILKREIRRDAFLAGAKRNPPDPDAARIGFTFPADAELSDYEHGTPVETVGTYPGAVALYQQRLMFARSDDEPQTVWASEIGAFNSMAVSHPLRDDNAITATADSKQMNEIRHLVPLKELLVLTSGAEFRMWPGNNSDALTPTHVSFDPQSYWGANDVDPVVSGRSVLLVQNSGRTVRDLYYQLSEDGYTGNELTILAGHLVDSPIVSWAYQQSPYSTVWTVLESGRLLSLTYMRDQEVWAWSGHESAGGAFRSVLSIREGRQDAVYFLVERNGRYFLEEQVRREYGEPIEQAWFLDCALRYEGSPVSRITGLTHLAGRAVSALVDGQPVPGLSVASDGSVQLPREGSVVTAGLPYEMTVRTLDPEIKAESGPLAGDRRSVVKAEFTVRETLGLDAGPDEETLLPLKFPAPKEWGKPPELYTGTIEHGFTGRNRSSASILFRQTEPLPATVLSVATFISVG